MPLFKNISSRKISFDVAREHFEVEPGQSCEIPKMYVYVIESRGLPLEATKDSENVADSTPVRAAAVRLPDGVQNATVDDEDDEDSDEGDVERQLEAQAPSRRRRS